MMIYGVRTFGQVNNTEHSHVTTNFFHINYIPLVPTSSWLITAYGDMQLPGLHWPAVLHGYAKGALVLLVLGATIFALMTGIEAGFFSGGMVALVGVLLLIVTGVVGFYGINTFLNQCFVGAHPLEEQLLAAIFDEQQAGSWDEVP